MAKNASLLLQLKKAKTAYLLAPTVSRSKTEPHSSQISSEIIFISTLAGIISWLFGCMHEFPPAVCPYAFANSIENFSVIYIFRAKFLLPYVLGWLFGKTNVVYQT